MRCKQKTDRMVLTMGAPACAVAIYLALFGFLGCALILTDCFSRELSQPKTLGELFFILLSLFLAFCGLWMVVTSIGHKIVIDAEGVHETQMFPIRKHVLLKWEEIADWGFAYERTIRTGRGIPVNVYALYFSDIKLPMQEKYIMEKKIDKECISLRIGEGQIKRLYPIIVKYCCHYTEILPFRTRFA